MKNIVFFVLMFSVLGLYAQGDHEPPHDTINSSYIHREITYFYPRDNWRERCVGFDYHVALTNKGGRPVAQYYYTDSTLKIAGVAIAATKSIFEGVVSVGDSIINVNVFEAGSGELNELAHAPVNIARVDRWMMIVAEVDPWDNPSDTFVVPLTEVYFDSVLTVEDSFYVGISDVQMVRGENFGVDIASWGAWMNSFCQHIPMAYYSEDLERWCYSFLWNQKTWFIFPIIDSTGWYLGCDTMVCPAVEDAEVSVSYGMALMRWGVDADSLHGRWHVSYGPVGTEPGMGRVLSSDDPHTVLYGLEEPGWYVAYVRGYCTECHKWGAWNEGVEFYFEGEESVDKAESVAEELRLVPNPARERVRVETGVSLRSVAVHDMGGRLMEECRVVGRTAEIELKGWPAGVYRVTAITDAGVVRGELVLE
ncbi:MAG: hypothetical protein IKN11_11365 [Bacteroidales bacterium]|nr:hypothetical protein [Bacteroidales bacterium]